MILETTYLVDLEREAQRGLRGPAIELLEKEAESVLTITFTIAGEMAAGLTLEERSAWEQFLSPYRILGCDMDVCWRYGELYRLLQGHGSLIGANDLWIAATALAHDLPLVTNNTTHFERIPDLTVVGHRSD
ncbi:MAG: PIN domain-containing protein [Acidimicrobiia bacterium]|nr:PIN domain-containing protein [Acidimicrobiia bacterium]